jgi:DNA-binding XRE family transcriptional regulator
MDAMVRSMVITTRQLRAARAMIGLTQAELASEAGISTTALNSIEAEKSDPKLSTLRAIQAALEAHGIQFMNNGGVRMRTKNERRQSSR